MIDMRKLKELVKLMVANDLTELDIQGDEGRLSLKRGGEQPAVQFVPAAPPSASAPIMESSSDLAARSEAESITTREDGTTITSPMVGTFYSAPTPDAKPFVSVGDVVQPDTVVCIIEAMKVFNEIKADVQGAVTEILIESGEAVEFGQPLIRVQSAK